MSAPTVELIRDHVWRPPHGCVRSMVAARRADRACEFMNCRRPRAEHARWVPARDGSA